MVVPVEVAYEGFAAVGNIFLQPIFIQFLRYGLRLLPIVLTFWWKGDRIQDENEFENPLKSNIYDFIIVGGGSSGAVAAYELSRYHSVLLLEQGGEPSPIQLIPLFSQFLPRNPEVDFSFRSEPQEQASGVAINRQTSISAGLGLGGSGTLNVMVHLRGHVKDYDNWAAISGDANWGWSECLPYFKRYEDFEIPGDEENHGYGGPLRIEAPDYIGPAEEFLAAARELGYPTVDLNAPYTEGFDVTRYPIRNGIRQATYKAFIEPIRTRLSFNLMKFAIVKKILFKKGNVAYGVEYDRHGESHVAYARKEVIISAGSLGTPKLLMLSGIGPRQHLQNLGIPVLQNLPVGENLRDHLSVFLGPFFLNVPRSLNVDRDVTASEFVKWFTLGRGKLTTSAINANGVFSSSFAKARGEGGWPDLEVMLACVSFNAISLDFLSHTFNLKVDIMRQYLSNALGEDTCYVFLMGSRPFSKGSLKLGGPGPYDLPIIDPNYLTDDRDLEVLVDGVNIVMNLMENTTSFGETLGVTFTNVKLPGCSEPFRTDAYWKCYIKSLSVSTYHYSGTAAMGSVVDTKLRVLGTKNLRVLDNSIAPQQISTNTQASVLMIAEKGADMILRKWKGVQYKQEPMEVLDEKEKGNIIEVDQDPYEVKEQKTRDVSGGVIPNIESVMAAYQDVVKINEELLKTHISEELKNEGVMKEAPSPIETEKEKVPPTMETEDFQANELDSEPIEEIKNPQEDLKENELTQENVASLDHDSGKEVKISEESRETFNEIDPGYANIVDKEPVILRKGRRRLRKFRRIKASKPYETDIAITPDNIVNENLPDDFNELALGNIITDNQNQKVSEEANKVFKEEAGVEEDHTTPSVPIEIRKRPRKLYREMNKRRPNMLVRELEEVKALAVPPEAVTQDPPVEVRRKRKRRWRVRQNQNEINEIQSVADSASLRYAHQYY